MKTEKLKHYFVYVILLILLVLITIYLFKQLLGNPVFKSSNIAPPVSEEVADSYVKNAHIISYSNGVPKFDFTSSYILHYSGEKESSAVQPKLKVFPDKESGNNNLPWLVLAKHAWLSADTSHIRMEDDVLITQKNNKTASFSQLETSILWIWPKKEYAQTDRYVKITTNQALITAIGMNANLQTTQYHFLNNVRVTLKQ
ncbi:MAG: LPS export ABC transporter periplasmic protein LptC [Pseudomonadota bacterium]